MANLKDDIRLIQNGVKLLESGVAIIVERENSGDYGNKEEKSNPKRFYRVRFGYVGGGEYSVDFLTLEAAERQLKILKDEAESTQKKELYEMEYDFIYLRIHPSKKKGKKKREDDEDWDECDSTRVKYTIGEFLALSRESWARTEAVLYTKDGNGHCCTAEGAYQAICHSKSFFNEKCTSLEHWSKGRADTALMTMEKVKPSTKVSTTIEDFCCDKNYQRNLPL